MAALLATVAACGGGGASDAKSTGGDVGGTLVAVLPTEPEGLFPTIAHQVQDKMVIDQLFDPLASIGSELNTVGDAGFRPRLAERWTWSRDSLSIAFHLDPRARWHDNVPVRSSDVRFTFQLGTDTTIQSNVVDQLSRVDSVSTPDSLTAVFWFKRRYPEQFYDVTYDLWIVPEHVLKDVPRASLRQSAFNRQPVGTGRFHFARWEPGVQLELAADTTNYRGRPKLDRIVWTLLADPSAKIAQLLGNEIDAFDRVSKDEISRVASQGSSRVALWNGMAYGYVLFNRHARKSTERPHPILDNVALRSALAMALGRSAIVRSVFDSLALPAVGPMTRSQMMADTSIAQPPFDTVRAAAILDSLGWRRPAPGAIRIRQGRPLRLAMLIPSVTAPRVRCATIAQEQWRRLGVQVDLEQVDGKVFYQRFVGRDFDLLFNGVSPDPSIGGVRSWWTSTGANVMGSMNAGGWADRAFDAHIDSALATVSVVAARRHASTAYAALMGNVPAIWIYEARNSLAINRRFRNVALQPDGWWQGIADWTIPAADRLPRDRIGLTTKAR